VSGCRPFAGTLERPSVSATWAGVHLQGARQTGARCRAPLGDQRLVDRALAGRDRRQCHRRHGTLERVARPEEARPAAKHAGEDDPEAPTCVELLTEIELASLHPFAEPRERLAGESRELGNPGKLVGSRRLVPRHNQIVFANRSLRSIARRTAFEDYSACLCVPRDRLDLDQIDGSSLAAWREVNLGES
jgi:hypothetical protein